MLKEMLEAQKSFEEEVKPITNQMEVLDNEYEKHAKVYFEKMKEMTSKCSDEEFDEFMKSEEFSDELKEIVALTRIIGVGKAKIFGIKL